ncbi:exported protein of unknown function [Legionella micdadei]|uniref:Uncharacterized protein n=1 Tax=Legionella micdadei TaxID=451 RepID=A0A098GDJ6_LEGMI|nr:exported protein of unknown function [Legionella micdadei]
MFLSKLLLSLAMRESPAANAQYLDDEFLSSLIQLALFIFISNYDLALLSL